MSPNQESQEELLKRKYAQASYDELKAKLRRKFLEYQKNDWSLEKGNSQDLTDPEVQESTMKIIDKMVDNLESFKPLIKKRKPKVLSNTLFFPKYKKIYDETTRFLDHAQVVL